MSLGRVFQKVEAATENERGPTVDRRYGGTSSCCVNDDRNHISCRRAHSSKPAAETRVGRMMGWMDGRMDRWTLDSFTGHALNTTPAASVTMCCILHSNVAYKCKSFLSHKGPPGGADLHRQTPTYTARPRKCG